MIILLSLTYKDISYDTILYKEPTTHRITLSRPPLPGDHTHPQLMPRNFVFFPAVPAAFFSSSAFRR